MSQLQQQMSTLGITNDLCIEVNILSGYDLFIIQRHLQCVLKSGGEITEYQIAGTTNKREIVIYIILPIFLIIPS